jgi:hypothetical protein
MAAIESGSVLIDCPKCDGKALVYIKASAPDPGGGVVRLAPDRLDCPICGLSHQFT